MTGFTPPPYPYGRLDALRPVAAAHEGGVVDLSIGTPCDPPLPKVVEVLASSDTEPLIPGTGRLHRISTPGAGLLNIGFVS